MDGQLPGEAGASGTSLGPVNPHNKLSDGLLQLAAAEGSRAGGGTRSPLPQKKKANRSLRTDGSFLRFYCRGGCVSPEGGRVTSSAGALAKARRSSRT